MRRLTFCFWLIIAGTSASTATELNQDEVRPVFFGLPDYTTKIVKNKSNLFLNPEESLETFDPSKIKIIGIGSAGDINYAFISNSGRVAYVTSGHELLKDVYVENVSILEKTVELSYKGKLYALNIDNSSKDK